MTKRFEGKAALVTGAASGIGRATAQRLGREGATLVLADIDLGGAERVAEAIRAEQGVATAVYFDAAQAASCREMVDRAVDAQDEAQQPGRPLHENVRGGEYYH